MSDWNKPPNSGKGGKSNKPPRGGKSGNKGGHGGGSKGGNQGPQGGPDKGCAVMALALVGGLLTVAAGAVYGLVEAGKAVL